MSGRRGWNPGKQRQTRQTWTGLERLLNLTTPFARLEPPVLGPESGPESGPVPDPGRTSEISIDGVMEVFLCPGPMLQNDSDASIPQNMRAYPAARGCWDRNMLFERMARAIGASVFPCAPSDNFFDHFSIPVQFEMVGLTRLWVRDIRGYHPAQNEPFVVVRTPNWITTTGIFLRVAGPRDGTGREETNILMEDPTSSRAASILSTLPEPVAPPVAVSMVDSRALTSPTTAPSGTRSGTTQAGTDTVSSAPAKWCKCCLLRRQAADAAAAAAAAATPANVDVD